MLKRIFLILLVIFLVGCGSQTLEPTITTDPTATPIPSVVPTITATPQSLIATLTPLPPEPTAIPKLVICSPLDGILLQDLPDTIVNPFAPPRTGSDDPHQGVDFADIDPFYQITLEGRTVNAVIDGIVAGVVIDRFPYGNVILVETYLEQLPAEGSATLQIPTPAPIREGHPILTCPEYTLKPEAISGPRSLYLLYAHLKAPVTLKPGNLVTCGMPIGTIGNSGNSLNPHVHIEMRVGPADIRFDSMAHYTDSATPEELSNYCLWRVSEAFQLLDPMRLLSQAQ